ILSNVKAMPHELAVHLRIHLAPFNRASVWDLIDNLGREGLASKIAVIYFAPLFNYHTSMTSGAYRADGKRFATSEQFASMEIEALHRARRWGFKVKDFLDVSYGICTAVRANTFVVDPYGNLVKCYKDVGVEREKVGTLDDGVSAGTNLKQWLDIPVPRDQECAECAFLPVCL